MPSDGEQTAESSTFIVQPTSSLAALHSRSAHSLPASAAAKTLTSSSSPAIPRLLSTHLPPALTTNSTPAPTLSSAMPLVPHALGEMVQI